MKKFLDFIKKITGISAIRMHIIKKKMKEEAERIKKEKATVRIDLVEKIKEVKELLKSIDMLLKEKGMPKRERKQFWRDFHKNDTFRNDIFSDLLDGALKKLEVKDEQNTVDKSKK